VTPDEEPPRLAWGMWKRFLAAMFCIVFLTGTGTVTAALLQFDTLVDAFNRSGNRIADVEDVLDDVDAGDPQTILVLGSDRRFADKKMGIKPRSDTIILVRLDPSKGATAVLSVPRDLKVKYKGPNGVYSDKINAAYSIGGPKATINKVKQLMESADGEPFQIHHVVNINFGAFRHAVDRLGCFYIDVDRRYFNDNRPPVKSPTNYAAIDLKPGYQKLCGQDSLDFVRFRHLDTDIVRGARQQHYLSLAKDQTGVGELFGDRERLLELFGRYTDTDIHSTAAILRLLKLTYESSRDPLRRVKFRADLGSEYVTISRSELQKVKDEFLNAEASEGSSGPTKPRASGSRRKKRRSSDVPGLVEAKVPGEDQAVILAPKIPFPVYYPKLMLKGSRYWDGFGTDAPRSYGIRDEDKKLHRAYRMVVEAPGLGEYYGIQATDWKDAPILASPSEERTVNGRKLLLFRDGSRLRMVAWKGDKAAYWVANTLLRSLNNAQMLGIARSLTRVGRSG
jgi:polyisoprenyl-teichoic acid--peptidoglycan teichoic acid transferase